MTFAERLRIAIEQNGFTPMSFAEHLGWSIQRLSLHISQDREPRLSTLQLFIKELPSVDIIWLVTGSKMSTTPQLDSLIEMNDREIFGKWFSDIGHTYRKDWTYEIWKAARAFERAHWVPEESVSAE